jgi:hypothetical protein
MSRKLEDILREAAAEEERVAQEEARARARERTFSSIALRTLKSTASTAGSALSAVTGLVTNYTGPSLWVITTTLATTVIPLVLFMGLEQQQIAFEAELARIQGSVPQAGFVPLPSKQ